MVLLDQATLDSLAGPDLAAPHRDSVDAMDYLMSLSACLSARQARVVHLRFAAGRTLRETGATLGVSAERVRTIEAQALRRLSDRARLNGALLAIEVEA